MIKETNINSRIKTIKNLLDAHFAHHIQLANVRNYLEVKQSYMQDRYFHRSKRIKDLMDECNGYLGEASRCMREIRHLIDQELSQWEGKKDKDKS